VFSLTSEALGRKQQTYYCIILNAYRLLQTTFKETSTNNSSVGTPSFRIICVQIHKAECIYYCKTILYNLRSHIKRNVNKIGLKSTLWDVVFYHSQILAFQIAFVGTCKMFVAVRSVRGPPWDFMFLSVLRSANTFLVSSYNMWL
jgi:hypothetical protein